MGNSPKLSPNVDPIDVLVDKQPLLLAIIWAPGFFAMAAIIARLWVRIKVVKAPGKDDIVISLCFAVLVTVYTMYTVAVHYGLGRHILDFTLIRASRADEFFVFGLLWSELLLIMLKVSVLLMIERVFEMALAKYHRWIFYIMITLLAILTASQFIYIFTECIPTRAIWEPYLAHKMCENRGRVILDLTEAFAAFSAFIDVVLALYPVYQISKLKLTKRKKIVASLLVGSGAIASAFAIARCATLYKYDTYADPLYNITNAVILALCEVDFLVWTACAPALAPLFRRAAQAAPPIFYSPQKRSWPSTETEDSAITWKSSTTRTSSHMRKVSAADSLEMDLLLSADRDVRNNGSPEGERDLEAGSGDNGSRNGSGHEVRTSMNEDEVLLRPFSEEARAVRRDERVAEREARRAARRNARL